MGATGKYPKKVDWKAVDEPGIADWLGDLAKDREAAHEALLPPPPVDPEEERWKQTIEEAKSKPRTERVYFDESDAVVAAEARKMAKGIRNGITYDADGNDTSVAATRAGIARALDVPEDLLPAATTIDEFGRIAEVLPPMPAGLEEQFGPMGVRPADGPTPPAHGTMKVKAREKETTVKIETMTRRSAVTGAHGIYAEGRVFDAKGVLRETRRAFLAAEFLGTSTIASTAKGARWEITAYESGAEEAQAAFRNYLAVGDEMAIDPLAIICELTAGDIDRIRRGVMPSLIYPAAGLLEEAVEGFKDQVD